MLGRRLVSLLTLLVVVTAAACRGDGETGDTRTSAAAPQGAASDSALVASSAREPRAVPDGAMPTAGRAPAPDSTLTGEWWLRSFGPGAAVPTETVAEVTAIADRGSPLTLVMREGGRVSGFSGCNLFMGSASGGGRDSLVFGPLASTRRACPEPNMGLEAAYEEALARVRRYEIRDDGRLALSTGDEGEPGTLLVFAYHGPPPDRPGSTGGATKDARDGNAEGTP